MNAGLVKLPVIEMMFPVSLCSVGLWIGFKTGAKDGILKQPHDFLYPYGYNSDLVFGL